MINYRIFFGVISCVMICVIVSNLVLPDQSAEAALIRYQLAKVKTPADIIVLGDSSVGNSLDASSVSRMLNKKVLNMALTGAFAVDGSLQMLLAYTARNIPACVFIVQSPYVFPRKIDPEMVVQEIKSATNGKRNAELLNIRAATSKVVSAIKNDGATHIHLDYIRQGSKISYDAVSSKFNKPAPSMRNMTALDQIGALCLHLEIKCFLAFGPVADKIHDQASAYTRSIQNIIGIQTLNKLTPFSIHPTALGDTEDHVSIDYKILYSTHWADVIRASCP